MEELLAYLVILVGLTLSYYVGRKTALLPQEAKKKTEGRVRCYFMGHVWGSVGGRECPEDVPHCSQPVFRCRCCGVFDYGEKGGPGHAACVDCIELAMRSAK